MRRSRLSGTLACSLLVAAGVAHAQTYHVIAIPLPEGFTQNDANGINAAGVVVGSVLPGPRAYRFDPEAGAETLAPLPNGSTSIAYDVNDAGVVAGRSDTLRLFPVVEAVDAAVVWTTPASPVGLPSDGDRAAARAINANGTTAGGETFQGVPFSSSNALAWSPEGAPIELSRPAAGSSGANDVNDAGVVVGSFSPSFLETHAFRWDPIGGATELLGFNTHSYVIANAVDAAGTAVGASGAFSSDRQAVRWTDPAEPELLGALPDDTLAEARAIAPDGATIVGYSSGGASGERAFVWTAETGMQSLNAVSDASEIGMTLQYAMAINASGQIAGMGLIGETMRAFVATPVPEPALGALAVAPALLWLRRRRAQSAAQK